MSISLGLQTALHILKLYGGYPYFKVHREWKYVVLWILNLSQAFFMFSFTLFATMQTIRFLIEDSIKDQLDFWIDNFSSLQWYIWIFTVLIYFRWRSKKLRVIVKRLARWPKVVENKRSKKVEDFLMSLALLYFAFYSCHIIMKEKKTIFEYATFIIELGDVQRTVAILILYYCLLKEIRNIIDDIEIRWKCSKCFATINGSENYLASHRFEIDPIILQLSKEVKMLSNLQQKIVDYFRLPFFTILFSEFFYVMGGLVIYFSKSDKNISTMYSVLSSALKILILAIVSDTHCDSVRN